MTCSEIISELETLKKNIEFYEKKRNDKGKVAKKIYSEKNIELFMQGLEEKFAHILPRRHWDKIDLIIERLKDPDLTVLGVLPFNENFLEKL